MCRHACLVLTCDCVTPYLLEVNDLIVHVLLLHEITCN